MKQSKIQFSWKKNWKLLFKSNDKIFVFKRYIDRDASVYKPLRIDWILKYYFWQIVVTVYMILMKPLYLLAFQYFRYNEYEVITLSGRDMTIKPIEYYEL